MELQELRIGNYVLTDDNFICQVSRIETKEYTKWNSGEEVSVICKQINTKDLYLECDNDNWQPIELTEEILLKCPGVENRNTNPKSYYLHNRIIFINDNGCYDYATRVKLPYLHTFQNFIFALTSKELTINL